MIEQEIQRTLKSYTNEQLQGSRDEFLRLMSPNNDSSKPEILNEQNIFLEPQIDDTSTNASRVEKPSDAIEIHSAIEVAEFIEVFVQVEAGARPDIKVVCRIDRHCFKPYDGVHKAIDHLMFHKFKITCRECRFCPLEKDCQFSAVGKRDFQIHISSTQNLELR